MKIVALTDIHGKTSHLAEAAADLEQADLVVLAGDITNFGSAADAAQVVDAVRYYNHNVLAITGNCDRLDCEQYLEETGIAIHRRHVMLGGLAILGVSGSLPCPGRTPSEASEADFEQYLNDAARGLAPGARAVLVCHQPPYNTVADLAHGGLHVGSQAVRRFIEQSQPLICFTGHIHEGRGTDRIANTFVVNPGPFMAGHYAWAELEGNVKNLKLHSVTK